MSQPRNTDDSCRRGLEAGQEQAPTVTAEPKGLRWIGVLLAAVLVAAGSGCGSRPDPEKLAADDLCLALEDVATPDSLPSEARDAYERLYGIVADDTISPGEEPEVRSSVEELCAGLRERDGFCGFEPDDFTPFYDDSVR